MTEAEWLACLDPTVQMQFLRQRASKRKLRLFACACLRRAWETLSEADRNAVMVAERFADGLAKAEEMPEPFDENGRSVWPHVCYPANESSSFDADVAGYMCACAMTKSLGEPDPGFGAERALQADLARDIFGPLAFNEIRTPIHRLSSTCNDLAVAVYDERAFDRLPILGDALEDAGCTDATILDHCRGRGPHARGCWVVDLILQAS